MTETTRTSFTMPGWMEKYRELFVNTGGNSIEELMNDVGCGIHTNSIRAALCIAVESQVLLLRRLKKAGLLSQEKT
jgi:hypothetical protein